MFSRTWNWGRRIQVWKVKVVIAKSSLLIVNRQQAHCGNCKTFGAPDATGERPGAPECQCDWQGWTTLDFDVRGPSRNFEQGLEHALFMPFVSRAEIDWTA